MNSENLILSTLCSFYNIGAKYYVVVLTCKISLKINEKPASVDDGDGMKVSCTLELNTKANILMC